MERHSLFPCVVCLRSYTDNATSRAEAVSSLVLPLYQSIYMAGSFTSAIYKTHVHAKGYKKFEHPERYGMARELNPFWLSKLLSDIGIY
jgi:hypothetical protein